MKAPTNDQTYNTQIVHREVFRSFSRLSQRMEELSDPDLDEHCKIWKHQKGVKKLIELAIESDRFIGRETKSLKSFHGNALNNDHQDQDFVSKIKAMKQERKQEEMSSMKKDEQKQDRMESESYSSDQSFSDTEGKLHIQAGNIKLQNNESEIHDSNSSEKFGLKKLESLKKQYLRGPYKNYSRETKEKVVQLYNNSSMSVSKISAQYDIPIKNIKRWAQNGIDRKEGAGRKRLDPSMERNLFEMIKQKYPVNSSLKINEIRYLALNLSRVEDFKASKGWTISFIERYNLAQTYQILP